MGRIGGCPGWADAAALKASPVTVPDEAAGGQWARESGPICGRAVLPEAELAQMTPLDTVTAGRERAMATNGGATFSELDWLRSGRTAARRLRNWTDEVDELGRRRGNIAEGSNICSRCSRSYAVEEEHIPSISEGRSRLSV